MVGLSRTCPIVMAAYTDPRVQKGPTRKDTNSSRLGIVYKPAGSSNGYEVEVHPFGSANPDRTGETAVLRLIPEEMVKTSNTAIS